MEHRKANRKYGKSIGLIEMYECNAKKGECDGQIPYGGQTFCMSPYCPPRKEEQSAKIESIDIDELEEQILKSEQELAELGIEGLEVL